MLIGKEEYAGKIDYLMKHGATKEEAEDLMKLSMKAAFPDGLAEGAAKSIAEIMEKLK